MSAPELFTYADAHDALVDFARAYSAGAASSIMKRAIGRAYRRLTGDHEWSFLYKTGRLKLEGTYTTGSVEYDAAGGATCERQLTLTTGVWPDWIVDGAVYFDDIVCDVEKRFSDTVIQLDTNVSPLADVAAGTSYTAFKRWYALPNDFQSMAEPLEETSWLLGAYVTPARMEQLQRYEFSIGDIYYYTIAPAQDLYGTMALYIHGVPDVDETLDIPYRRRLRPLVYSGQTPAEYAGTIAVTAGSASVVGTGTSFATAHAGSILRIGTDGTNVPTGIDGLYPYGEQRSIYSFTDATGVTLDNNVATTRSGVKYRISDPIDMDAVAWDAFLACCETEYAKLTRMKDRMDVEANYQIHLHQAKGSDFRIFHRRVAASPGVTITRLKNYATNRPVME